MNLLPKFWYTPTFHGDIRLEALDEKTTILRAYEITPLEAEAMKALRDHAITSTLTRSAWCERKDFLGLTSPTYRTTGGVTVKLFAKITAVQAVLAKVMKPDRKMVHAVRFGDGRIEEVRELASPKDESVPEEKPAEKAAEKSSETEDKTKKKDKPEAGVSVAAPVIGCPTPDFPQSEIRANRVLEAFLTPIQCEDYHAHGAFVAKGADTGHQYIITHRERAERMKHVASRSLYDLTAKRPLCVHDWTVPPPEEMLALLLCITLPGNENKIRILPQTFGAHI